MFDMVAACRYIVIRAGAEETSSQLFIALKMSTSARQAPSPSRRKMHKDFPGTSMLEPFAVRTRTIWRPIS
jgi:hypothetical protein